MAEWLQVNRGSDNQPVVINVEDVRDVEECSPVDPERCNLVFRSGGTYQVRHSFADVAAALAPRRLIEDAQLAPGNTISG